MAIREIRPNEPNNVHIEKPKTLDTSRVKNPESQAAFGHKYPEVPFEHKTEQAQLEDKLRKLELEADRLKKEGDGLKKKGEEINQSFWEQVDDLKRWRDGMTNYQPDQSTAGDTNPFRSGIGDTNPFRSMVGNEQFSGDFTPKHEEKFSSFADSETKLREERSGDSTHKNKNFEDKRLENELKILMRGKFGDEIVKSDLLKNLGTEKTDTEVTKIDKGNPSVYRDGNTYFVTYDERNAQGYFGANKDLSKIRCQVSDGLLRELEAKEAYVKWDLPMIYRIHLEKPEGKAEILITDDEAAVGKRMKDGWAVREVIEGEKGFSLVDVRKNELPSYNEIMSDGNKKKVQDKIFDWSHTEDYEAPPPPYPGHEGITSNKDVKEKAKIESENFGEFEAPPAYEDPPAYKKQFTYEVKKAVRKVWAFLSGDKRQRIGLDNRQSEQRQSDLQGYPQDKKQGFFASDYDKKSDILYAAAYDLPPAYPGDERTTSNGDMQKNAEIESKRPEMFESVSASDQISNEDYKQDHVMLTYTENTTVMRPTTERQRKAGMHTQEIPWVFKSDQQGENGKQTLSDIVQENPEAPPAYDENWLKKKFSVSNYSPREQEWSGLSGNKKTKKPVFKPLRWGGRVNNFTPAVAIWA